MGFVLTGWTFISIETERGEQPACLNCLVDFISVRKQEYKAFKNVGKSWGFVLRFFFSPQKSQREHKWTFLETLFREEKKNQLPISLLGRKEEKGVESMVGKGYICDFFPELKAIPTQQVL